MTKTVATFEVGYTQILNKSGKLAGPLPAFAQDPEKLIELYRAMVLSRAFDAKAINLQRTGRLGTFPSAVGQEAVSVGTASAMLEDDVFLPSFREHGAQLIRGVTLVEQLLYWGGDERGSDFSGPKKDFPMAVPVGTHAPHAAGVALAMKLRGEERAAVCLMGDGATSRGDVYESWNMAGAWSLPVVYVINNNQWAISMPRSAQSAAETLAQKAIAAGFPGEQVDGNDVIAVYDVVDKALKKARAGGGAHLIEAVTYRLSDHTTADDASRYRSDEEVSARWSEEPILRMRTYLTEQLDWKKEDEEALIAACAEKIDASVEEYLATGPQSPDTMFKYLYANLPPVYAAQRAAVAASEADDAKEASHD